MPVFTCGEPMRSSQMSPEEWAEADAFLKELRASHEARLGRLLDKVLPESANMPTRAVIGEALSMAIDVTHECGTEEDTDRVILETFWDAIGALKREGM